MKYTFNHTNYADFDTFEHNKLVPRSFFIPFVTRNKARTAGVLTERTDSSKVTMLNGEWDFKYYSNMLKMPRIIDSAEEEWDKIQVPSVWQFSGYEAPCYINDKYDFDFAPPLVPEDGSVALYKKSIYIKNCEEKRVITFLGVSSALELYVNGQYVGYSEGSHNTAEFDLTSYFEDGKNEIVALVYKFCNGSYLECQDMFRSHGIFRDVYITNLGEYHLWDFKVETQREEDTWAIKIDTDAEAEKVGLLLVNSLDQTVCEGFIEGGKNSFYAGGLEVLEWCAERPNLYYLYISIYNQEGKVEQVVKQEIGFRDIKIVGHTFLYNNKKIKFKGVNHHDTSPKGGYYMTPEEWLKDVELMKKFNVNSVRTAHYPPDPLLIKLANIHGLHVCLEADIETHGAWIQGKNMNAISNNMRWKNHYWDRVLRMYERDKNNPSVTMLSYGNEAGGYKCFDYVHRLLLERCKDIPKHYEGSRLTWKDKCYDIYSEMYSHIDLLDKAIARGSAVKGVDKPYFLCEYAHSMGVGPGGLDEYVKRFLAHDMLLGGCIWEFADHAVEHTEGSYKYTYGGDHGERVHDSNFCIDGLFAPDRKPHPAAWNMRAVYRPLRFSYVDGKFSLLNTNSLIPASEYKIKWTLHEDGKRDSGGVAELECKAGEKVEFELPITIKTGDVYINFEVLKDGLAVSEEQIILSTANLVLEDIAKESNTNLMSVDKKISKEYVVISFNGGCLRVNQRSGEIDEYTAHGQEYMLTSQDAKFGRGFTPHIARAPIDNDKYIVKDWKKQGLLESDFSLSSQKIKTMESHVLISSKFKHSNGLLARLNVLREIKVYSDGRLDIEFTLKNKAPFTKYKLPRFGVRFVMPKQFSQTEYFGFGDMESLDDFTEHTLLGLYKTKVGEFEEPHIKPQESGSRRGVRFARVTTSKTGAGLLIEASGAPLYFKASKNFTEDFAKAAHQEDLPKREVTAISLDKYMRPAGSGICGPQPFAPHDKLFGAKDIEFAFRITPIRSDE